MTPIKTIKFTDGHQLEIIQDQDPESPREWDNLGTMVCWARRHNLGDEKDGIKGHGIDAKNFGCVEAIEDHIRSENPDCVMLPLYLFDHSGITMNTTGFSCPWDSRQVGLIFVSREKINEEYGENGGRTDEQIEEYLRNEVATYDQYLRGDIYGFIMREPPCWNCGGPGEDGDSCWGFFGDDPIENGMIDDLDDKYREELRAGKCEEVCS